MAGELTLECKLSRSYAMMNVADALSYLLIKVIPNSAAQLGSMPLNIGLVIDVSRSMKGKKLEAAIEATRLIIASLQGHDWLSVTTFSDDAQVVIPCVQASDKAALLAAVDKIRIIGATRMFHGMEASIREIRKAGLQKKINRMILLTDGETEGEERCNIIATQERQSEIVICPVGIGKRYNENLLSQIADVTLGHFSHLKAPEEITDIFKKELGMAAASVISDVTMGLSLNEGVRLESLDRVFPNSVRLETTIEDSGRTQKARLGNLMKDDLTIVGARLKLPSSPAGRVKIANIQLQYSIPSLGSTGNVESYDVFMEFTDNQELCGQVDREVISYFNQINAQNLIEEAIRQTRIGNIDEATKSLSLAQSITEKLGNLPLTQELKEALDDLEAKGVLSADSVKTIKAGSRQTVKVKPSDVK
jgi:Ca-activated chloride channel family protein